MRKDSDGKWDDDLKKHPESKLIPSVEIEDFNNFAWGMDTSNEDATTNHR